MKGKDMRSVRLEEAEAFVRSNPRTSPWLRQALEETAQRDPLDVLNEVEMLRLLLLRRLARASSDGSSSCGG
ncbi:conserved protein [Tepidicaulis marinus]|uniref:Conserved protein n=2 Tax=Tepidicaulis marinus TaxID=1333998 RepID=A0A081B8I4_9HYPH|nr:conserved protein [Tepidicaulis marinus]